MKPLSRLTCRSVRRLLWEYAAERLSEGPMETVERHLADCENCRREMEALRRAQVALVAYRRQEPPASQANWQSLRQRLTTEGTVPLPIGEVEDDLPTGRLRSLARHPGLAMVSSVALVTALAGIGFGVFGTKIALQAKPPALPAEQTAGLEVIQAPVPLLRQVKSAPSLGTRSGFDDARSPSLPLTRSIAYTGSTPGLSLPHPKQHREAAKPFPPNKSSAEPDNKESAPRIAKAGVGASRRTAAAPKPANRPKPSRPETNAALPGSSEEQALVAVPHRYIMGTLTPTPRDDIY
jgi:hypothetical protein